MPKQKKYKNLLKVAATTNSSIDKSAAAGSASQAKSTAGSASLVKSVAAGSASQAKSAAGSASLVKSAAAGTASQAKSAAGSASQAKSTAAAPTTSKTSSQSLHSEPSSVAPTTSERSSEPTRKRERESKHYWTVDAIDEYGVITSPHLLVKNVDNIPEGLRIIVHFDEEHAAIGEAAGLLAGVCGQLASHCTTFPISFEKWSDIPDTFFEKQWNSLFLNLCKRNQEIRHKQTIPHTSGAKSIARRKTELVKETGKKVTRVEMWDITHKKKGGSYVNEKAKEIAEKIEAHNTQQSVDLTGNSPLDALGVVLGKEHPGHVRGLGMGAVPTVAFKNTTTRITHMNLGSSSDVGTSSTCGSNVQEELDTVKAQLQALVSYIASKEGGKIPDELAAMFPNQTAS